MDKISGILPSSPRMHIEDNDGPPARPGAPDQGRTEGSNEIKDRVTLSSIKNVGIDDMGYARMKDLQRSKIADDLARNFFKGQAPSIPKSNPQLQLEQMETTSKKNPYAQVSRPNGRGENRVESPLRARKIDPGDAFDEAKNNLPSSDLPDSPFSQDEIRREYVA